MTALRFIPKYFVRGCVALAPVALTAYILYLIFTFADDLLPFRVPGLGIAVAAAVITLVGYLTSNVIGRGVLEVADRVLSRLPLVKLIYASLKDLIGAFGDRKSFKQPVSVALVPDKSVRTLGFITRDDLAVLGLTQHVAVYLPQAYNFAGNLIIVPRDRVELLAVSPSEAMTFIVSGGVSGLASARPPAPLGVPATTVR
ncbi:MAG TPA: DUF502 domain-containing protein [Polyangia bacterium]